MAAPTGRTVADVRAAMVEDDERRASADTLFAVKRHSEYTAAGVIIGLTLVVILLRAQGQASLFRPGDDDVAGCLRNVSSTYVPALTRHGRRHQRHQLLERADEFHEQLIDWQTALSPADLDAATTAIAAARCAVKGRTEEEAAHVERVAAALHARDPRHTTLKSRSSR